MQDGEAKREQEKTRTTITAIKAPVITCVGWRREMKGITKERSMWTKKMRFQTAAYIEKQHVNAEERKQQTTGEKKGKGLISGATQGQYAD